MYTAFNTILFDFLLLFYRAATTFCYTVQLVFCNESEVYSILCLSIFKSTLSYAFTLIFKVFFFKCKQILILLHNIFLMRMTILLHCTNIGYVAIGFNKKSDKIRIFLKANQDHPKLKVQ